jgi:hypothetical protein
MIFIYPDEDIFCFLRNNKQVHVIECLIVNSLNMTHLLYHMVEERYMEDKLVFNLKARFIQLYSE